MTVIISFTHIIFPSPAKPDGAPSPLIANVSGETLPPALSSLNHGHLLLTSSLQELFLKLLCKHILKLYGKSTQKKKPRFS